jgi:hypothetical protein
MNLKNFTLPTSIEVLHEGTFFDLHNCFDWQTLAYLSEEKRIEMKWRRSEGDWVSSTLPPELTLQFRGVSRFAASPRNPAEAFTEDSCLEFLTFTPPEFDSNFEGEWNGYRADSEHLTLRFMSGFAVKMWAEEVELFL